MRRRRPAFTSHSIMYPPGHPIMVIRPIHKVYPSAPRYGHVVVSQCIPQGTPLWPFGRFTMYNEAGREKDSTDAKI